MLVYMCPTIEAKVLPSGELTLFIEEDDKKIMIAVHVRASQMDMLKEAIEQAMSKQYKPKAS